MAFDPHPRGLTGVGRGNQRFEKVLSAITHPTNILVMNRVDLVPQDVLELVAADGDVRIEEHLASGNVQLRDLLVPTHTELGELPVTVLYIHGHTEQVATRIGFD